QAFRYFNIAFQSSAYYQAQAYDIENTFEVVENTSDAFVQFDWNRQLPVNVDTVKLTGVESAVQLPFYFLPAPFNGFGVLGNVAYVHGSKEITGLSKLTANATLYYETALFGVRGSLSHRSSYQIQPLDKDP